MHDTTLIATWIRKKQAGSITPEEMRLLKGWADSDPRYQQLLQRIDDGELLWNDVHTWQELDLDEEESELIRRIVENTFTKIQQQSPTDHRSTRYYFRYFGFAASLLLLGMAGFYFFQFHPGDRPIAVDDLDPATNRARLTMSSGEVIDLDGTKKGVLLTAHDLRYDDGSLLISLYGQPGEEARLSTPRGGKYHLTLSDGTEVWLNAGTTLTYPTQFDPASREVRLEGEAYFKVANQSSAERRVPFIVHTERQRIEVTGTEFNVMAHPGEPHTHTTLIEGKVNVSVGPETVGLDPGQQAVSNRQGMKVQAVEVARFIAWKDNEFYFSETPLREAISELSRWYDFDVVYEGPAPSTHLYGSISRDEGLVEVLRIMEAGGVQFKLEKLGGRNRLIIDKE